MLVYTNLPSFTCFCNYIAFRKKRLETIHFKLKFIDFIIIIFRARRSLTKVIFLCFFKKASKETKKHHQQKSLRSQSKNSKNWNEKLND